MTFAPVRERGLKLYRHDHTPGPAEFAPVRERGLKQSDGWWLRDIIAFAPVRERGLKQRGLTHATARKVRSRAGAWIETLGTYSYAMAGPFAPVRERGLKHLRPSAPDRGHEFAPVRERGHTNSRRTSWLRRDQMPSSST